MVEDFICNLKVYRVAQGFTQEQLAKKSGSVEKQLCGWKKHDTIHR